MVEKLLVARLKVLISPVVIVVPCKERLAKAPEKLSQSGGRRGRKSGSSTSNQSACSQASSSQLGGIDTCDTNL